MGRMPRRGRLETRACWVECEEFSDEDEEVPDENAPENWETTDELEESSNEAEPSHGESDRGGCFLVFLQVTARYS
jgi:hypothetical protein